VFDRLGVQKKPAWGGYLGRGGIGYERAGIKYH
jgi:hypothetical protein